MTQRTEYPHGVFCWVDLNAHDLEAAKRWYCALFGWTAETADTYGGPPYVMFSKHGKLVAGAGQMSEAMLRAGVPSLWNDYVKVDDCAAIEAKVIELGGTIMVPTMQVLDAGWLCFLQDPGGVSFALWQPNQHHGAQLVDAPGSFCWNELATRDLDQAKRFYTALLGWEYGSDPRAPIEYTTIKAGGRENGGIITMSGPHWEGIPPYWNTYFAVADADAALATITETGGKLLFGPRDIPGVGRFAVVSDPQGALFSVMQLTHPPD
jgi:hypothetical protein